jgi:hypothetical protein
MENAGTFPTAANTRDVPYTEPQRRWICNKVPILIQFHEHNISNSCSYRCNKYEWTYRSQNLCFYTPNGNVCESWRVESRDQMIWQLS